MALGNIPAAGFETEQRMKLEKRLRKLEARVEKLELPKTVAPDEVESSLPIEEAEEPSADREKLIEEAVELKLAAPSVLRRWKTERLVQAIAEAKK